MTFFNSEKDNLHNFIHNIHNYTLSKKRMNNFWRNPTIKVPRGKTPKQKQKQNPTLILETRNISSKEHKGKIFVFYIMQSLL